MLFQVDIKGKDVNQRPALVTWLKVVFLKIKNLRSFVCPIIRIRTIN